MAARNTREWLNTYWDRYPDADSRIRSCIEATACHRDSVVRMHRKMLQEQRMMGAAANATTKVGGMKIDMICKQRDVFGRIKEYLDNPKNTTDTDGDRIAIPEPDLKTRLQSPSDLWLIAMKKPAIDDYRFKHAGTWMFSHPDMVEKALQAAI